MNNFNKFHVACLILLAASGAHAQTSSTSTSGSNSGSSSVSGANAGASTGNGYVGSVGSTSGSTATSNTSSQAASGVSQQGQSTQNTVSVNIDNGGGGSGSLSPSANGGGVSRQEVAYSGTQTVKTNPAIASPSLTTTLSDTCMGSISVGLSLPGFGATGGKTLVDEACVRRLDAREFRAMGLNDVALALLCQSPENKRAVEATGHHCPGDLPLAERKRPSTAVANNEPTDNLIRERMGLPLLYESNNTVPQVQQAAQPAPQVQTVSATNAVMDDLMKVVQTKQ